MAVEFHKPKITALGCVLRIVFGLIVLAVVVGGGGSFYVMREFQKNRAALKAEVQRIRALREPLGGAELNAYCQIPAGETDLTEVYLAALAPLIGNKPLPQKLETKSNTYIGLDSVPLRPIAWDQLEEVERHLAGYDKLLSDLVAAGKLRGSVRYPVDFQQGASLKYDMPMVANSAQDLLFLRAVCQYHRGDFEGATDTIIATVRLGESLRLDPMLLAQLFRMVAIESAGSTAVHFATDPEFPAQCLARIQAVLSAVNLDDAPLRASLGERAGMYQKLQLPQNRVLSGGNPQPGDGPSIEQARPGDSAILLHLLTLHVETSKLPWDEGIAVSQRATSEIDAEKAADQRRLPWDKNYITSDIGPTRDGFFGTMLRSEAQRRSAVTICALERFQRERGSLPESLTELVPDFLDAIPTDPAKRQPLRFVRSKPGYKVYSIGLNQLDDGGDLGNSRGAVDFGFEVLRPAIATQPDAMP